ncbi:MAG: 50S ribosomal protein L1 [Thaumarchaeota archaeon]|nr:50S ribosomal protein L1 [Candidatus Calditenuaceae archaeon]MDW8187631.1 50S ribosomal protein L1 [Nitrososphaerota archaeon]
MLASQKIVEGLTEAVKASSRRGFVQSVELMVNLKDIDLKRPESRITETIELPRGLGSKPRRVAVVATGALVVEARKSSNVDKVFEREEIELLIGNKKAAKKLAREYDYFLVDTSLISLVARALGSALGFVGKAPVPVPAGSDIDSLASRYKRSVTIRVRKNPQAGCVIGTQDMPIEHLVDNAQAVLNRLVERLPKKWVNVDSVYMKLSMGEPVRLSIKV